MSVAAEVPPVGALLRTWRERRRFSQQELSNRSRVWPPPPLRGGFGHATPPTGFVIGQGGHPA
ncbi:hypothetical protein ACFV5G_23380, partial [Streptomyces sp. NPDC059766]